MGQEIQFPKNFERFIELGQEAINQQNFSKAVDYFSKAYEIAPDFPLNFLLTNTLFDLGEVEEALELAQEFKRDYYLHIDYLVFYIQLLVGNHQFVQAHQILNERILQDNSEEMNKLVRVKKEVRHAELLYRQFEKRKINELKEELLQLTKLPAFEQMAQVKKSIQLPQDDFLEVAKVLLLKPETNIFVKSWLIEELSGMNIREKITFLWLNKGERAMIPAELSQPYESQTYKRMIAMIEKELGNNDPILLINMVEEIRIQFALLYPFADEVIAEPELWALAYLEEYAVDFESHEDPAIMKEVRKEQRKLRIMLNEAMV
ncbi:MAG: hypothetical protein LBM95_01945 [Lactobacillales bacterium]|nr:hypothetical protein [Lactobacillales bacterium]